MLAYTRITLNTILKNFKVISTNRHYSLQQQSSQDIGSASMKPYDEIRIPVPWGHVAGKWYGPKDVRPILGLHGWQDNAGTFDRLAPLLPEHVSFLAIDFPGHGESSWYPLGMPYDANEYTALLLRIMSHYKWPKLSIMAHSFSSMSAYTFCGICPDMVDMYIGLDMLKPLTVETETVPGRLAEYYMGTLKMEQLIGMKSEPPYYDWDVLVDRQYEGSLKQLNKDVVKYILQRNTKPSPSEPNKFYFSRDSRLKYFRFYLLGEKAPLELGRRIKCPHLYIKTNQGVTWEKRKYHDDAIEVLRQSNPLFEYHIVDGTHYVHINNPERIAPLVNAFINKYRPQ